MASHDQYVLTDIRLCDFRCFDVLDFHPSSGRTFILGDNAQGKTSILESICFLLRLQSPRTTTPIEAVRFGKAGFSLDGHSAGAHLTFRYMPDGREIFLDSKPQTRTDDYLGVARVAWFANDDLDLVRGGSSIRRRYLDFLGVQSLPGYRKFLRAYERALRSRNALLKEGRPYGEVAAFDEPLVENGESLLEARARFISELSPLAASACSEISGRADSLAIEYRAGCAAPFREALAQTRNEELRLRQTVAGPHRDDFLIMLNGMPASHFSSEGQQRSIALALKMAQARYLQTVQGRPPLFLLDDIFGELDPMRRNRLLDALPPDAQSIITTTFIDWIDYAKDDVIFHLSEGKLTSKVRT